MTKLQQLIDERDDLVLIEIREGKHEVLSINSWIDAPVKDYINANFDVVGTKSNLIVFLEK